MKTYTARIVDANGKKQAITEQAISQQLFEDSLYNRGYFIIDVKEASLQKNIFYSKTISKKFLLDFCFNVYSLLEFGIDINEVFKILSDIYTTGKESEFIQNVLSYLKKGEKLSMAIKHSKSSGIFDEFFLTMVSSGEHSGNLTDAFKLIHEYIKNNQKIKEKLLTAMVYPIVLLVASFFAMNLLLLFILPRINEMYKSMDFAPSLFISIMFFISSTVKNNIIIYIISIIAIIAGIVIFLHTQVAKNLINLALQKLPVISKIAELQSKIKTSFSIEILLRGGSSLEEAFTKLGDIEKNEDAKNNYLKALSVLKSGNKVSSSLKNLKIYNKRDINIVEIADSISKTKEGFEKIYADSKNMLDNYLETIFKLIDPAIMIFIAGFIFLIMYLVMSPTLGMMEKF